MGKEDQNIWTGALLLLICILVIVSYIFIPEQLMIPINILFGIPLGNLITAIGFISASLFTFYMPGSKERFRLQKYILLILTIFWLPVSIFLSGNVYIGFNNDTQSEMRIWLIYTVFTGISIFILILLLRFSGKSKN